MSRINKIVIPFGWKRQIQSEPSSSFLSVTYVSPSGIVLSSIAEVCQYLENDTTCKCGLQCPLHVPKIFSFNPEVQPVKKSKKEWSSSENGKEPHKTNCIHWKKLKKTCIDTNTFNNIPCEPPPKLLIIRKAGRLTSVIPDNKNAASSSCGSRREISRKKPSVFADADTKSDLSVTTKKKSSALKSPLFEAASRSGALIHKQPDESKSDFKLQWIKADDELSHNDSESSTELCFSPDFKKSPPMAFPQLSLPGFISPSATQVKLEDRQGLMNTAHGHFMQSNSGMMSSHMGVEPVHRFGMSAFPGTNFVTKNNSGIGVSANNSSSCPNQLPRYPAMSIKSERQSFQGGGMPAANFRFSYPTNAVKGCVPENERMQWSMNQQSFSMAGNMKQQNVGGSHMGQITPMMSGNSSIQKPLSNQQSFPLQSPPPCHQTSPYGVVTPGQTMPLSSPGQRTLTSPFSNKSNSSFGTPTPSPIQPGQRQSARMSFNQDHSRPLSRSSNTSTPKADMISSPMAQFNPGIPGAYAARTPGGMQNYNPVLSPGPISPPFSPQRFSQSARISNHLKQQNAQFHQEYNQSMAKGSNRFSKPNITQQQLKNMVTSNMQQMVSQQFTPNINPHLVQGIKMQGNFSNPRFVSPETAERNFVSNQHIFPPNMSYRPPRVRYAQINEPEPNNMQQGPSMPIAHTNIKIQSQNSQLGEQGYYRPGFQSHMPWPTGHPRLPTLQNPYQQVVMSHHKYIAPRMNSPTAQQTKPKRKRVRKNSKMKVENQPSLNQNLIPCDLPDFLDPQKQALNFEKSFVQSSSTIGVNQSSMCNQNLPNRREQQLRSVHDPSPNLVIPQILQSQESENSEKSTRSLTNVTGQRLENNSQVTLQKLVDHSVTISKQTERNVVTPPLPLISPTSILDETNDTDDFSDFASPPLVFSFPGNFSDSKTIAATYLTPSSQSRQEKLMVSGTKPIESVKLPQDKHPNQLSHSKPSAINFTCSNVNSKSSAVFKSPTFQRTGPIVENTLLVSSSGKLFRMNPAANKCRRFSDGMSVRGSTSHSDARKRIKSDPFPSVTQSCSRELQRRRSTPHEKDDKTVTWQQSPVSLNLKQGIDESPSKYFSTSKQVDRVETVTSKINIHNFNTAHESVPVGIINSEECLVVPTTTDLTSSSSNTSTSLINVASKIVLKEHEKMVEPICVHNEAKSRVKQASNSISSEADLMKSRTLEKTIISSAAVSMSSQLDTKGEVIANETITVQQTPNSQHCETNDTLENIATKCMNDIPEKVPEIINSHNEILSTSRNLVLQTSDAVSLITSDCYSNTDVFDTISEAGGQIQLSTSNLESKSSTSTISKQSLMTVSDSLPKNSSICNAEVVASCNSMPFLPVKDSEKPLQSGLNNVAFPYKSNAEECKPEFNASNFDVTKKDSEKTVQSSLSNVNTFLSVDNAEERKPEFDTSTLNLTGADSKIIPQSGLNNASTFSDDNAKPEINESPLDLAKPDSGNVPQSGLNFVNTFASNDIDEKCKTEFDASTLEANISTKDTDASLDDELLSLSGDSIPDLTISKFNPENIIDKKGSESQLFVMGNEPAPHQSDEKVEGKNSDEQYSKHEDTHEKAKQSTDFKELVKKKSNTITKPESGNSKFPKTQVEPESLGEVSQSSDHTSAASCISNAFNANADKHGDTQSLESMPEKESDSIICGDRNETDQCLNLVSDDDKVIRNLSPPHEKTIDDGNSTVMDQVLTSSVTSNLSMGEIPFHKSVKPSSNEDASNPNTSTVDESLQSPTTSSINLGFSSDLTDTVIRQLSNYNTILKNLLVSGVAPVNSATLAQLTAGAVVSDEQKAKMLSILMPNNVKMNMLQSPAMLGNDLTGSSSSSVGVPINQVIDESSSSSFCSQLKQNERRQIADVIQKIPEIDMKDLPSLSLSTDDDFMNTSEADDRKILSKAASASSDMIISSNQGLQVPIVSSSVKGMHTEDISDVSVDVSGKSGLIDAESESISTVLDEVSTSIKDVESSETLSNKDPVGNVGIGRVEPRRGRTRNSAVKVKNSIGNLKRSATELPGEKAQKRLLANTSVQMPSNLRPIHRSSEKQTRIFKSGDLVWGQMRGYPSWPGKIVKPSEVRSLQQRAPLSDGKAWVKWFGDHTFTQMNPADLRTMTEGLEAHHKSRMKGRTRNRKIGVHLETAIQEAVDELEQQQELKQGSSKNIPNVVATTLVEPQVTGVVEPTKKRRGKRRKR